MQAGGGPGIVRLVVFEDLRLDHAERRCGGKLADESQATHSQEQHVVGALRRPLLGGDPAQAGGGMQLGTFFVVLFPAGLQQPQRDQTVVVNGLLEHLQIPRLEDMERLHHMGKHHEVGQRKNACLAGKLIGGEGQGFVRHGAYQAAGGGGSR